MRSNVNSVNWTSGVELLNVKIDVLNVSQVNVTKSYKYYFYRNDNLNSIISHFHKYSQLPQVVIVGIL